MSHPVAGTRRDAKRNRQALIEAFVELLRTEGVGVPLYRVARRAGLGQATLYRHFPERALLAKAVYEQRLDRLEQVARTHADDPRAFVHLLRELLEQDQQTPGLLGVLRERPDPEHYIGPLIDRAIELLARPLCDAKAAGVLRPDLEVGDLQILFAMLQGVSQVADNSGKPEIRLRALELVLEGLVSRPPL